MLVQIQWRKVVMVAIYRWLRTSPGMGQTRCNWGARASEEEFGGSSDTKGLPWVYVSKIAGIRSEETYRWPGKWRSDNIFITFSKGPSGHHPTTGCNARSVSPAALDIMLVDKTELKCMVQQIKWQTWNHEPYVQIQLPQTYLIHFFSAVAAAK